MADPPSSLVFFAAGVIGFGPAIGVLYHALRTYDYPYTEKSYFETRRVIAGIAVGMILGTASGVITVALRFGILTLLSLVIVLLLLAAVEEGFKLVYLNRRGYRGRFDTTFVGVGLGIGVAAIVGAGSAYTNGPNLFAPTVAASLLAFSVSLALVHGTTGAIIGLGCSKEDVLVPFAQAFLVRALHAAMLVPFFVWSALSAAAAPLAAGLAVFSLSVAIAFTLVLYGHAYRTILPSTLPTELRRKRRRRVRGARGAKD